MFNWWMMIFLLLFIAVYSSIERAKAVLNDESEILTQAKYIEPAEKETLFSFIAIPLMWSVPILVELLFSSVAIFIAHLLNNNLSFDDIHLICLTPAIILIGLYCSRKVYEMLFNHANDINHPIYNELGVIGTIVNTCVIEWGGHSIAKTLEIG
jgi:hypothetical protein